VLSAFSRRFPQVYHTEKCPGIKNQSLQITLAHFFPIVSHIFSQLSRAALSNEGGRYPVRLALANENFK
jgi:hypothetical protein